MSLKTDYKDAVFQEKRKYRMLQNEDGTVSFEDATSYTQEGDSFGAKDINDTNTEINKNTTSLGGLKFQLVSELPSDAGSHTDTVYILKEGS